MRSASVPSSTTPYRLLSRPKLGLFRIQQFSKSHGFCSFSHAHASKNDSETNSLDPLIAPKWVGDEIKRHAVDSSIIMRVRQRYSSCPLGLVARYTKWYNAQTTPRSRKGWSTFFLLYSSSRFMCSWASVGFLPKNFTNFRYSVVYFVRRMRPAPVLYHCLTFSVTHPHEPAYNSWASKPLTPRVVAVR